MRNFLPYLLQLAPSDGFAATFLRQAGTACGLKVLFCDGQDVYKRQEKGLCLSARSNGSINVQVIMEALGGGGHQTVAGAQFGEEGNIKTLTGEIIALVRKQIEEEKE